MSAPGFAFETDEGLVYIEYTEESIQRHLRHMPFILRYLAEQLEAAHERHEKTIQMWKECDQR